MLIDVTQEDIDAGIVCAQRCPVSMAIKRKLGGNIYVATTLKYIAIGGVYEERKETETPNEVKDFIDNFDSTFETNKAIPKPFSFELAYKELSHV